MTETTSESVPGELAPHPIDTDFSIGQDNVRPFGLDIHNPVFVISGISIVAFVIITLMFKEGATEFFGWLRPFLTSTFDWFFSFCGQHLCVVLFRAHANPTGERTSGRG